MEEITDQYKGKVERGGGRGGMPNFCYPGKKIMTPPK